MDADFGFTQIRTRDKCAAPLFNDHNVHRVAIVKDFHIGSEGDIDEGGVPGWISKFVCTECKLVLSVNGHRGYFYPDDYLSQKHANQ